MLNSEPKVDLSFQILGKLLSVDHGYALYSAISRVCPAIHEDAEMGLKLIRGRYLGEGRLDISPYSELVLRAPVSRVRDYLMLAGKSLEVGGNAIRVGVPHTRALIPGVALFAQLVTTRNGQEQGRFADEMGHQMGNLGIKGRLQVGKRRTFQVHGKQVVGYSVLLSELTAQESIMVQEQGLGGRRKMGCGFFEVWQG
jgi:CRISPR-associated protein Cas6